MIGPNEGKLSKSLRIISIFAILCCCALLFPQVRNYIVEITERARGRDLHDPIMWMKQIFNYSLVAIISFVFVLLATVKNTQDFLARYRKYGEDGGIFILATIVIVLISIIVRIVMYVKCRSLYLDEALLAENIVTRNWLELLAQPLGNMQSAPVLYVISIKLIGSLFGYSEFSLRVFSLLSFIGLLICEKIFLKRALGYDKFQTAFVVAMTALLPTYIWYSNELKPYMSDAFFVILTILLYFYYTQDKIKLPALTFSYILIFGFSSPAIFFIGGMLFFDFLTAVFHRDKKQIFSVFLSGAIVLVVFGLYYHWWIAPVSEGMKAFWNDYNRRNNILIRMISVFSSGIGNSDSSFVIFFVPFAALGFFSLGR